MKKSLLFVAIIVLILMLIAGAFYYYWKNQPVEISPLQQVVLDNPEIDSFDDVCTEKDEYELECQGNIEQFGCEHYRSVGTTLADLQPNYPMLVCEKKNNYVKDEGVYRHNNDGTLGMTIVDYIFLQDGSFQLVQSADQFRQLFQPIESTEEAKAYFIGLRKAFLLLSDDQLSRIKSSEAYGGQQVGSFTVSPNSLNLSEVSDRWNGYAIVAYSSLRDDCVSEVYQYRYLLKKNGHLVEKDKQLIWESKSKPPCIN